MFCTQTWAILKKEEKENCLHKEKLLTRQWGTSISRKYEKNAKLWHSYVYPYAFVRMSSLAHISLLLYAHAYTCLSSEDHDFFSLLCLCCWWKPGLKLSNELISTIQMKIFMKILQREGFLCILGGDALLGAWNLYPIQDHVQLQSCHPILD